MLESELVALFEEYSDEYLKFDRVEKKLASRPDLHAFCCSTNWCRAPKILWRQPNTIRSTWL